MIRRGLARLDLSAVENWTRNRSSLNKHPADKVVDVPSGTGLSLPVSGTRAYQGPMVRCLVETSVGSCDVQACRKCYLRYAVPSDVSRLRQPPQNSPLLPPPAIPESVRKIISPDLFGFTSRGAVHGTVPVFGTPVRTLTASLSAASA